MSSKFTIFNASGDVTICGDVKDSTVVVENAPAANPYKSDQQVRNEDGNTAFQVAIEKLGLKVRDQEGFGALQVAAGDLGREKRNADGAKALSVAAASKKRQCP